MVPRSLVPAVQAMIRDRDRETEERRFMPVMKR